MLKLIIFLAFALKSYIAAPVLLSEIISNKINYSSNKKNEDILSINVNAIIDVSVLLNDVSRKLLGSGSVSLEGSSLLKKESLFNLYNSSLSVGSLTLKIPESNYIASINKSSMFEMAQVILEGYLSKSNLFRVNGGSVVLMNVCISTDSSIMSFVKSEELGSNLKVVGMTLNSNEVCGNEALLYSTNTEVKDSSFSNITSHSSFSYKPDEFSPSDIERVSSNTFYNCENVFKGLILTMDMSREYISNNNTYKKTLGLHRSAHYYYGSGSHSFDSDFFDGSTSYEEAGGAIFFEGKSLTIKGCYFYDCTAYSYGGAICFNPSSSSGNLKIQTSDFESCYLQGSGGAIYIRNGGQNIYKCRFLTCFTQGSTEPYGGAICVESVSKSDGCTISNCYFNNSISTLGGGISSNTLSYSFYITNTTFTNNQGYEGGAIDVHIPGNPITVTYCAFKNNKASHQKGYDIYAESKTNYFNESSITNSYTNVDKNSTYIDGHVVCEGFQYNEMPEDLSGCPHEIVIDYVNTENNNTGMIIGIVFGVVGVIVAIVVTIILCYCCDCCCFDSSKHISNSSGSGTYNETNNTTPMQQEEPPQNIAYVADPPTSQ